MSGRRDLFQRHSGEADFLERFDRTMEDVEKGRTPVQVAAQAFGLSPKQFQRTMNRRKEQRRAAVTYAKVDKFEQLPGLQNWTNWLKSKYVNQPSEIRDFLSLAKRCWEEALERKSFDTLTENDIVKAATWAKELSNGRRFRAMLMVRALVRGQYGKHEWLSRYLSTKGLKPQASFPPEITTAESYQTVLPRLFNALDQLISKQTATADEIETLKMVILTKVSLGPRTGNAVAEREMWGCKINAGRTSLAIDQEGKISSWTFFAKKGLVWGPIPPRMIDASVRSRVEDYVRKHGLKTGDSLIQNLHIPRALKLTKAACKLAGLSPLRLHDFRKMYGTGGILGKVPLEVMCDMGVGWKDMNTLKTWYVAIKNLNATEEYDKLSGFLQLEKLA